MTRRVPDEAKRLRGTLRKDRVTHAATDRDPVIPERPDWLGGEAARMWDRMIEHLHDLGVLGRVDGNPIARYCQLWQRWKEAEAHIAEHGAVVKAPSGYPVANPNVTTANKLAPMLHRLEQDFGLSPTARNRLGLEYVGDDEDDEPEYD